MLQAPSCLASVHASLPNLFRFLLSVEVEQRHEQQLGAGLFIWSFERAVGKVNVVLTSETKRQSMCEGSAMVWACAITHSSEDSKYGITFTQHLAVLVSSHLSPR